LRLSCRIRCSDFLKIFSINCRRLFGNFISDGQPDWEDIIQKYDISLVFFAPRSPIAAILRGRKEWSVVYSDEVASIFVRNNTQHRGPSSIGIGT
jgi:hypothetical protein